MRKNSGRWLTVLVALVLAAANLGSAQRSDAKPNASDPKPLWEALGDTTLARLVADALHANRDIRMAEARVRQARAARQTVALDRIPTVTMAAGYTRQRIGEAQFGTTVPDRGLWDTELRGSYEIDIFGRVRRSVRAHDALTAASDDDLRDVQRVLAGDIATAYLELRGAEEQLRVARDNAENQRRTLEITKHRLDAGRGNAFDSERAQAQLSSTLASIPAAESRILAAQYRIAVLMGRQPEAVVAALEATCETPELPTRLDFGVVDSMIRSRPDVRSAEQRLAAEAAFVGAAKAEYLPRLALTGSAGLTSTGLGDFGGRGSSRYSFGPAITWPAFNLGRVKAAVSAARANQAEAEARFEQTVLLAREDAARSIVEYEKARERLTHLTEAADAGRRAAELARMRFEGGVSDFLQVLDAERSLLAAQDELARGRTEAVVLLVSAYRAVGRN